MIYFTADHHFGHKNIIKLCNRPFSSIEEMDEKLISIWNSIIKPNDTVYHLGDFTLGTNPEEIIIQLNGKKKIIPGSHDWKWINKFKNNYDLYWLTKYANIIDILLPLATIKINKQYIVLCHYALRTWDKSHYKSWHLYGHSHGKLTAKNGLSMDIGVDCNHFKPFSLDEIAEIIIK